MDGPDGQRETLILHALRQVCNHPATVPREKLPDGVTPTRDVALSGKCQTLLALLEDILAAGEKALIFSSLKTGLLALLAEAINKRFKTEALIFSGDCDLAQRAKIVDSFNSDPASQVLLLTLGAGGTGLNLTAANHVIHFDRCYNPAKEAQATDRAFRIGQRRDVMVHYLTTAGSFEERLSEILASKQRLSTLSVAAGENWIGDLNPAQLQDLFALTDARRRATK